jgi:hypothetical protein
LTLINIIQLEFCFSIATEVNQDQRQYVGKKKMREEEMANHWNKLGEGGACCSSNAGEKKTQEDHKPNDKKENILLEWQRFLNDPLRHSLYELLK